MLVDETAKESIPRPQSLEKLSVPNGLSSSEVTIMDTRTLMIKDFNFGGLAPGFYQYVTMQNYKSSGYGSLKGTRNQYQSRMMIDIGSSIILLVPHDQSEWSTNL